MKTHFNPSIKNRHAAGFTLIELMVSLMIFTIVVLAAVGSLYSVNAASKKVQAMRNVLDNMTFAVESMSRTIRTAGGVACGGNTYLTTPNCTFSNQNDPVFNDNTQLWVDSTLGTEQEVEYRLHFNPDNVTGTIQKRVKEDNLWLGWYSITAPEIDIQKLAFYVDGAEVTDLKQPSVQIFVQGVAKVKEDTAPFSIQTYVSVRATE